MKTIHHGVTVSSELPITGVIDTTAPEWLLEEIDLHGIDLDFEEHCKDSLHNKRKIKPFCISSNYLNPANKNMNHD